MTKEEGTYMRIDNWCRGEKRMKEKGEETLKTYVDMIAIVAVASIRSQLTTWLRKIDTSVKVERQKKNQYCLEP